jgi:hypothetical protein
MRTWNNEKYGLSNGKEGRGHQYILENIKVGDEWIDGHGCLWICVYVLREEHGKWGGMVERRYAKKDRTPHKGTKVECFTKWDGFWDRSRENK